MQLAKQHAIHQWNLEEVDLRHAHRMDVRIWITQMVGLVLGFINILILAVVAWRYADAGHIFPGLAVLAAGTGATASVYGMGRALAKRQIAGGRQENAVQSPPGIDQQ